MADPHAARFDIRGERRAGRVGIWIDEGGGRESKIAAIGVRMRQWVSFHGVSLNVDPDLAIIAASCLAASASMA